MRSSRIICSLCLLLSLCACSQKRFIRISGFAQGGEYNITYNSSQTRVKQEKVAHAIDSILREIDFTLSGYNKSSLLSRLNCGERVPLSPMFEEIYTISYGFFEQSNGAFDISCAPIFDAWGFGFTRDSLPSPDQIKSLMAVCGMSRLRSDIANCTDGSNTFCLSDLLLESGEAPKLNFNAIAQGYSCDLVARYLRSIGVKDMLVDIGEIYCAGTKANGLGWAIGVDNPKDGNNSPGADMKGIWESCGRDCGLVTSGNYRKFYIRDEKKFAHTINPLTGSPVQHNLLSATIVAANATTADALATICMVIGEEEARKFIQNADGIEGYLISADSIWVSDGFTLRK